MKPSNVAKALRTLIAAKRPTFLHGQPGVGKTSIVEQVAADLGMDLIVSRLALMEAVDLRGLPTVEGDTTKWLTPSDFPKADCGPTIWFFDEWPQAMVSVQNAAGQLLNERRLGDYVLPDSVVIIGAGNRAKDRAGTQGKMPSHIADRFVHLEVEVDIEDWTRWALQADVSPEIIGFLRFRPALLSAFDPTQDVSPTPRSWQYVSEINAKKLPAEVELDVYSGTVGKGAAVELLGFLRVYRDLPTAESIIMSPDTAKVPEIPAALYAVSGLMARKATKDNFDRVMTYMRRLSTEFQVLLMKQATGRDCELMNTRAFVQWSTDNQAVLS